MAGTTKANDDIIGRRFGSLVACGFYGRDRFGKLIVRCLCDCGKESFSTKHRLVAGLHLSCGCKRIKSGSDHCRWRGCRGLPEKLFTQIKRSAENRAISFDVDRDFLVDLIETQNGKCVLSGDPISFSGSASLDRINSLDGYRVGNVQWVHKTINRMKWVLAQERFLFLCGLVCHPSKEENVLKGGEISEWMIGRMKREACSRGILFSKEMKVKSLSDLYLRQNRKCAITGLPIVFPKNSYVRKEGTASLDRIDSSAGYRLDNVQWVHKEVNNVKGSLDECELRLWASKVDVAGHLGKNGGV